MDSTKGERERGVTIKSTGVTLYFEHGEEVYIRFRAAIGQIRRDPRR